MNSLTTNVDMGVQVCVVFLCAVVGPILAACSADRFKCSSSNRCIDEDHVCDGYSECDDGSDERQCQECNRNALLCDGKCVGHSFRCDGKQDCANGTDEMNCAQCRGGAFRCDDLCWPNVIRCDGHNWCRDLGDEKGCQSTRPRVWCSATRCDGEATCSQLLGWLAGSDEMGCRPSDCNGGALFCDGVCKKASLVCNGYPDCSDGRDEVNCTDCKAGAVLCDGDHCIKQEHRCDGVQWCRDGTDEANCPNGGTNPVYCPVGARCNGVQDSHCAFHDDEVGCSIELCQDPASTQIFCDGRCILESRRCDGIVDCSDDTDESQCDYTTETTTTDEAPATTPVDVLPTELPEVEVTTVKLVSYLASLLFFNTAVLSVIVLVAVVAAWRFRRLCRRQNDTERMLLRQLHDMKE